jgi:L-histidine Nalpha-methyltransferase
MSTRPSDAPPATPADRRPFADDVAYYLSLTPRQLPSRYLYDDLGSALFEAISRLPWYRITRTERHLLNVQARHIVDAVQPLARVVELGPGSGRKLATLVDACTPDGRLLVHLVDVSPAALAAATRALDGNRDLLVRLHQGTYEAGLADLGREARPDGRTLVLFLGSNIGNFDPPGADAFLREIRATLAPGDALLLGADLVRTESDLLLAYDDPLGVTAAFNRNLLVRMNRELGATIDVAGFAHRAVWNAAASRIEMHLVSVRDQRLRVPAAHLDVTLRAGETIWTESSYKHRPDEVRAMLDRAGFRGVAQWIEDHVSLTLAEAA